MVNIGDRLWVRETIKQRPMFNGITGQPLKDIIVAAYAADDEDVVEGLGFNLAPWWKGKGSLSAIHMPRSVCRLTLLVKEVRVQRLQDISEEDAKAEGCDKTFEVKDLRDAMRALMGAAAGEGTNSSYRLGFVHLWESINGAGSWEANPFVYAISFEVEKAKAEAVAA